MIYAFLLTAAVTVAAMVAAQEVRSGATFDDE